jgi:hypothetical protein
MGTLIAEWIGTAITLFATALFLKFYYTSKMSRFYKKKWVIVACSFMILYSIIGIINGYRNYAQGKSPTKGELQTAIAANNTLVDQDFVFNSPDGYTLVVPAGYAYTTFSSGAISMIAIKKQSQSSTQAAMVVSRQQGTEELEGLIKETIKLLKRKNSTYTFSSESQLSISDKKAIKVNVDVEKEGTPIKGIYLFTKAGNNIFSIMMSCPASLFSQESAEFEKVIQSLRLR